VPGKENPADIISRGCRISELQNTSWFTGPTFLKLEVHLWPQSLDKIETIDADLEKRKISSFKCTESKENILDQILNSQLMFCGRLTRSLQAKTSACRKRLKCQRTICMELSA